MEPGQDPERPADPLGPQPGGVGAVEVAAFLCELGMLAVLVVAGWSLGSGGLMSIALAVFYPALAILIWSVWMAPRSGRRLADPVRLVAQVLLFIATAVLASVSGHPVVGITFGVIASAVFVATRFAGGITGS
jgi:hypothetical protein